MPSDPAVYRAPLRSRDDAVPVERSVRHALGTGVVGMGDTRGDDRAERRLRRFAEVAAGSYVWTLVAPASYVLGRIVGPCTRDTTPAAVAADLVHVRPCEWLGTVDVALVPAAVRATFARGGRNFQQIHSPDVGGLTHAVWELMTD